MTLQRKSPLKRTAMRASKPLPVQDPVPEGSLGQAPKLAQGVRIPARPLVAATAKKRAYEAELDALRADVLERSHGVCEARLPGCVRHAPMRTRKGIDEAVNIHHRVERSQGGRNTMANTIHACVACHKDGIHVTHHALARQWGLLLHAGDDPAAIPVRRVEAA